MDIFTKKIKIETIVERSVELVSNVENFRKIKKLKPISYEVGTEEVHGGFSDMAVFKRFLKLLKKSLINSRLDYAWSSFIVGKIGTDLRTSTFDASIAKKLVEIAREYNSYLKGHYTDFVSNHKDYHSCGISAANVGPEFTTFEYDAIEELCLIEDKLCEENKIACKSNLMQILEKAVLKSGRWNKWLNEDETDFNLISSKRRQWLVKTSCRYVWTVPEVGYARNKSYI